MQNLKSLSDEQLVLQFQATRNNAYFGEIYNRHFGKVYHTCLDIVKDRNSAFDLTQDVMIKVMEKLHTLKNGFLLGFWIYRIAQNQSFDFCKGCNHLQTMSLERKFDPVDKGSDMEDLYTKEWLLDSLEPALQKLKVSDRQLLTQKYLNNRSVEELEKEYRLTESAVKMRLSRARTRMAVLYQKEVSLGELRLAM